MFRNTLYVLAASAATLSMFASTLAALGGGSGAIVA